MLYMFHVYFFIFHYILTLYRRVQQLMNCETVFILPSSDVNGPNTSEVVVSREQKTQASIKMAREGGEGLSACKGWAAY